MNGPAPASDATRDSGEAGKAGRVTLPLFDTAIGKYGVAEEVQAAAALRTAALVHAGIDCQRGVAFMMTPEALLPQ